MGFSSKSLNYIKNLFFNEAYIYEPDIILIYNNIKDGGNNIIDYDYESTTTHHVLVTIDYEDFVRLKDDNLLIEY